MMILRLCLVSGLLLGCLGTATAQTGPASSARSTAATEARTEVMSDLAVRAGSRLGAPAYIVITKRPAELTVFLETASGRYVPIKTWPVCRVSGGLGPKRAEGDGKAPEGFYEVSSAAMNPWSRFHLSFNLGYPNAYDRGHGYTGSYLMVHGDCVSIGCYAMTDSGIEEIWTVLVAAFDAGQERVPVHIYPFAMPGGVVPEHYRAHPEAEFWEELAPAWAAFDASGHPPVVATHRVEGTPVYSLVAD